MDPIAPQNPPSRHELMKRLAVIREALRTFRIRDAADYAEILIAEAIGGQRSLLGITKGHDVIAEGYGRVEVKCRQLPADGRIEERIELSNSKQDGFDWLAIVVFYADFRIKGAVLVPYAIVWETTAQQRYNRLSYAQACQFVGAIDVTELVRAAAER